MDKIKNLSIRKTIVLYMAVSLLLCFLLYAVIVWIATEVQNQVWWRYVDEKEYFEMVKGDGIRYMADVPRPNQSEMTRADYYVSELCDFLQTYTNLILSMFGSCVVIFLFYKHKLKKPIEELKLASQQIAQNNLDFHITYEKEDEMGDLCREFERMRKQLADNNRKLWKNIEEEKALRAAIAHDIRSPLSVLKGYQEMLMEYLPDKTIDIDRAMDMLAESSKQIERMDVFVETMRKMTSLDMRELTPETITAEQLKNDIQAELDILEKKYKKRCVLQSTAAKDAFFGDREVILEVTENLLSNALRYAKEQIEIMISVTYMEVIIHVKDDGTGFQADMEEVTKLFYQQNSKDSLKHAGIGMYISRLYCEKHGGQLLIGNGETKGAVITAVFHRIA